MTKWKLVGRLLKSPRQRFSQLARVDVTETRAINYFKNKIIWMLADRI